MRFTTGLLSLFLLGASITVDAAMPMTGPAVPGFEGYDQAIPAFLQKWQVPGAAVAVAYHGRIVFARGYGYADRDTLRPVQPDTRFRIMSMSKPITAALILKLVEDGRLALDDRAFALLNYATPTYRGARRDARLAQITVRHLLTHSAGWVWDLADNPIVGGRGFYPTNYPREIAGIMGGPSPASAETTIRYMVGQPLQAAPGTVFSYTGLGYEVLGRLIELKTGLTYEAAVRQFLEPALISDARIGDSRRSELAADEAVYYDYPGAPLMQSSLDPGQFVPSPYGYSLRSWDAAGGWVMSSLEYLRFMLALDGSTGDPALLQPSSVAAMRAVQSPGTYYGYGWYTRYACSSGNDSGHGGGAWGSKTWALCTADGAWHIVALLNSIPEEAFGGSVFEGDAYAALHALPADFAPPDHHLLANMLGWDAWLRAQSVTLSGEHDDPDQDGVPNLIEYAAGLNPAQPDAQPPAALGRQADGTLAASYRRLVLEHAATWQIETSADGLTWNAAPGATRRTTLNSDGTLTVTVPVPVAAHTRLHVTRTATMTTANLPLEFATPSVTRLINVSTRAAAGNGDNTLIVGFTIEGPSPRTLLVRGIGPALRHHSVADALANPRLRLFAADQHEIAANNDWGANAIALAAAAAETWAFPLDEQSRDAALLVTLRPGRYTAHVSSADAAVGTALVETYEVDGGASRLVNLSTRARVGTGAGVMIAGFVITGDTPRQVLLRAIGPGLRAFQVTEALPDPVLTLMHDGAAIANNAGWARGTPAETMRSRDAMAIAGAFPLEVENADAAAVVTLSPGLYTMIVDSAAANSGVAQAEVYELP